MEICDEAFTLLRIQMETDKEASVFACLPASILETTFENVKTQSEQFKNAKTDILCYILRRKESRD